MNCVIDNFDFWTMEAQKYYAPPASWSEEKKKTNATNKIFSGEWVGAQKRDGAFYMCGRNMDGEIFVRPRAKNTKGEFVNKVDWVPHIHDFLNSLDCGTVFLGELYLPRDEQAKSTSSIMNSLQTKALKRQEKEENKLHLYIFDVLAENGVSYVNVKAKDRFDMLNGFWRAYPHPYVEWAKYVEGKELWDTLQNLLANGYEGMVIVNKEAVYYPGARKSTVSLKIKKEIQETVDCVIIGANSPTKLSGTKEPENWEWWFDETSNTRFTASEYQEKNGTSIYKLYFEGGPVVPVTKAWFNGWAGSLRLGLYDGENLIHVGDLSGVADDIRQNWKQYINTVVEISCMEISQDKDGKPGFRHPRAINFLRDKPVRECMLEQIL